MHHHKFSNPKGKYLMLCIPYHHPHVCTCAHTHTHTYTYTHRHTHCAPSHRESMSTAWTHSWSFISHHLMLCSKKFSQQPGGKWESCVPEIPYYHSGWYTRWREETIHLSDFDRVPDGCKTLGAAALVLSRNSTRRKSHATSIRFDTSWS